LSAAADAESISFDYHPIDLICELDASERLLLIDAGTGLPNNVPFLRINFCDGEDCKRFQKTPNRSTHQLGLSLALRLAESLGKRIDHLILWVGQVQSLSPMSDMSPAARLAVQACCVAIQKELCDARKVTC
jgi:hydrogenase maturation protease